MTDNFELLKNHPLFEGFEEAVVQAFVNCIKGTKKIKAGDILFVEGDEGNEIYFILSGKFEISLMLADTPDEGYTQLDENEFLGQGAVLENMDRLLTATAVEDSELIYWDANDWQAICSAHPKTGYKLVMRIAITIAEGARKLNRYLLNSISWGLE